MEITRQTRPQAEVGRLKNRMGPKTILIIYILGLTQAAVFGAAIGLGPNNWDRGVASVMVLSAALTIAATAIAADFWTFRPDVEWDRATARASRVLTAGLHAHSLLILLAGAALIWRNWDAWILFALVLALLTTFTLLLKARIFFNAYLDQPYARR